MYRLSPAQRLQIVELYYQNSCSVRNVFRALRPYYGPHSRPTEQTIQAIVTKFRNFFTLLDFKPPPRTCRVRTAENIAAVSASMNENRDLSIRQRSQQLGLCHSTVWKILHNDLNYNKTDSSLSEACDWQSYPSEHEIRRLFKNFESHSGTAEAEAPTNSTKQSTNKKRTSSKDLVHNETDEASEVDVNSTTVKKSKSSKGAKKETTKAETKSKGTKRKAAIKEDIPEDDVLPENEFTPEVLEEATKAKKPIKSKGSQKQLKEVEPVLVEEDASNQDQEKQEEESLGEKKTKRRKAAVNKAASKKAAKGKKDTVAETEPEAHTAQELDANIEASEIQVNGSVPNKAEPEKKAGRGRKRGGRGKM